MSRKKKGFTLIELMIVISIIGVLAAIAIPNFRTVRNRANKKACFANQKTLAGALEMYNLDMGENLVINGQSELKTLASKKYIQSVPADPGCKHGLDNYHSDHAGNVWCLFHGTYQNEVIEGPGQGSVVTEDGTCNE